MAKKYESERQNILKKSRKLVKEHGCIGEVILGILLSIIYNYALFKNIELVYIFIISLIILLVKTFKMKSIVHLGFIVLVAGVTEIIILFSFLCVYFITYLKSVDAPKLTYIVPIVVTITSIYFLVKQANLLKGTKDVQISAAIGLLFVLLVPIIVVILASPSLAALVGSFLAYLVRFYLTKFIPYKFSAKKERNDKNEKQANESFEQSYELNLLGKRVVSALDVMFVYFAFVYGISWNLTEYMINIKFNDSRIMYSPSLERMVRLLMSYVQVYINGTKPSDWSHNNIEIMLLLLAHFIVIGFLALAFISRQQEKDKNLEESIFKKLVTLRKQD